MLKQKIEVLRDLLGLPCPHMSSVSDNWSTQECFNLLAMPPKKRARKPRLKVEHKPVVPPKKRKTIYEAIQLEAEGKPIPEWLKISIQILLINYHPEGIALLNSIQSDYEAVFKANKVNPADYDFTDWEGMLRSPQFKKHFFLYTDKKIPYCKGYPLPRSACIKMKGGIWEIDPKMKELNYGQEPQKLGNSTVENGQAEAQTSLVEKLPGPLPEKSSEPENVEVSSEENGAGISSASAQGNVEPVEVEHKTLSEQLVRSKRLSSSETYITLSPVTPDGSLTGFDETDNPIDMEPQSLTISNDEPNLKDNNVTEEVFSLSNLDEHNEQNLRNEILNLVTNSRRPEVYGFNNSIFFRRSDVPPTWTKVLEYDDSASVIVESDTKEPEMPSESELVIDEDPLQTASTPEAKPNSHESDSATEPESDRISLSPPPPRLSPQPIYDEMKARKLELSGIRTSKNTRRNTWNRKDSNKKKVIVINKTEKSIRRISDSASTEGSAENSGQNSPDETDPEFKRNEVKSFMEWRFVPIIIERLNHHTITKVGQLIRNGSIINSARDPRITIGERSKYISKEDATTKLDNGKKYPESEDSGNLNEESLEEKINQAIQSEKQTLIPGFTDESLPVPVADELPDLRITKAKGKRKIETFVPLRNVYQLESHLTLEEPIPQDNFDLSSVTFYDLWRNLTWRSRLEADMGNPQRFFQSNIYDRWKELSKRDLYSNRMELIHELQKYEEKPYPSRCAYYLRSSLRMVEIDYRTNQQFSDPRNSNGNKLVGDNEILYYADFAGAPGGVVEFYNKTRKWSSKGFGVTYKKKCYDLHSIPGVIPEFFEPFYGKLNSYNGDGSLFCADTVDAFISRIMEATDNKGVHVVTSIGNVARVAFEDDNDEKWKYQHLAQVMVALIVLREGGNMAFKMYDLKTPFTVAIVYLLYRSFKRVQISKLNIFAPTSGERAVICLGKKSNVEVSEILRFLQECHKVLADWYLKAKNNKNKRTIEELIPYSILETQAEFMTYIRESNERMKKVQIEEFTICMKNLRNKRSIFTKGMYRALVARTTELWNVPNRTSFFPENTRHPLVAFRELRVFPDDVCEVVESILNEYNLYTIFSSTEHWRFSPVGNKSRTRGFYLGVDGMPHFFSMKFKEWQPVRDYEFRLPCRTLVYAEIIPMFSEDKNYTEEVFSIIDGFVLAGKDIKNLPYTDRIIACEQFCIAATKTFFPRMNRFTVTKAFDFTYLPTFLEKISSFPSSTFPNESENKTLIMSVDSVFKRGGLTTLTDRWFNPCGIIFFETGSKCTDFCSSLLSRVYWEWVSGMDLPLAKRSDLSEQKPDVLTETPFEDPRPIGSVSAKKLIDFVNRYS